MLSFRSFSPFVLALSIVLPLISHAFITKTAYWPEFLEEGGGSSQCVDTSSSCADYAFNYITHNSVKPSGEKLRLIKKYPAYTFDQLSTHFADHPPMGFNKTFKQRYWVEDQYYKPGGPVFFLDGGETTGMDRLVYLETGIVKYLAEATNGLGIIFEHRYYGRSHVAKVNTLWLSSSTPSNENMTNKSSRIYPRNPCSFSQPQRRWLITRISLPIFHILHTVVLILQFYQILPHG